MTAYFSVALTRNGSDTGIGAFRQAIRNKLISIGFVKDSVGTSSYLFPGDFDASQARQIVNDIYELESRHHPCRIQALRMRGELIDIEFRRNRYRSI